jgi:hypothetical protein
MVTISKIFEELYKRILRIAPKLTGAYWAEYSPEGFLFEQQKKPVRSFVFDEISHVQAKKPVHKILEVAFGAGYDFLRMRDFFKENKISYSGLDFSKKAVKYVSKKYGTKEARWLQGDMRNMTMFKNEEFDIVYLYHVIEHMNGLDESRKAMLELCRVTKDQLFIIWFKNPTFLHDSTYGGWQKKDRFYLYKHEFKDVLDTFKDSGYFVSKISYIQNSVWEIQNENSIKQNDLKAIDNIYGKISNDNFDLKFLFLHRGKSPQLNELQLNYKKCDIATIDLSKNNIELNEIQNINKNYDYVILDNIFEEMTDKSKAQGIIKIIVKKTNKEIFILEDLSEKMFNKERDLSSDDRVIATDIWKAFLETEFEIRSIHFADKYLWIADKVKY